MSMLSSLIESAIESVKEVIDFARLNGLTNTQEFINFEDELNIMSQLDPNKPY